MRTRKTKKGTRTDLIKPNVTLCSNEPEVQRVYDVAAKQAGLSPRTFERAITLIEKTPEELHFFRLILIIHNALMFFLITSKLTAVSTFRGIVGAL